MLSSYVCADCIGADIVLVKSKTEVSVFWQFDVQQGRCKHN